MTTSGFRSAASVDASFGFGVRGLGFGVQG